MPTVSVYTLDDPSYACPYIRILYPLIENKCNIYWNSIDTKNKEHCDVIYVQRHYPSKYTVNTLNEVIRMGIPIVYDIDDNFLNLPDTHPNREFLISHVPYIKWILNEADIITVSTLALKIKLQRHTSRPIRVLPNMVDWNLFYARPRHKNTIFNFMVSGTPTHASDWRIIEDALDKLLVENKNVNVIFFGDLPERFCNNPSVKLINFLNDYKSYAEHLKNLNIHAALIPLENTEFNKCKSNIKWLEYSACGIPGIYSNIEPYNSTIRNGIDGILVNNNTKDWLEAMQEILHNEDKLYEIVHNAQKRVEEEYSSKNLSHKYTFVLNEILNTKHKSSFCSTLIKIKIKSSETIVYLNKTISLKIPRAIKCGLKKIQRYIFIN